ncbi:MAG: hypothetical protein ACRCVU_06740 [Flavobacterium sp.]
MKAQLIQDNEGKTTGIFITMEDWEQIKKTIKQITSNPLGFEVKYRDIQIAFISIFPYGIHY